MPAGTLDADSAGALRTYLGFGVLAAAGDERFATRFAAAGLATADLAVDFRFGDEDAAAGDARRGDAFFGALATGATAAAGLEAGAGTLTHRWYGTPFLLAAATVWYMCPSSPRWTAPSGKSLAEAAGPLRSWGLAEAGPEDGFIVVGGDRQAGGVLYELMGEQRKIYIFFTFYVFESGDANGESQRIMKMSRSLLRTR